MKNTLYKVRFSDLEERTKIWKVLIKEYFRKYIAKNDTVLDIGCGFGEFINNIQCSKKIGLDIDGIYKKYLNKNVLFLKAASNSIPLKDKTVDKIFISNVFEHLDRDTIQETIKEFSRVLRNNGEVIVLQPNIRFVKNDYWMFFDHITPIDDRALVEVFSVENFKKKIIIEKFLPFTTKSKFPKHTLFVKLYMHLPFLWSIFGKQSLLVFRKK